MSRSKLQSERAKRERKNNVLAHIVREHVASSVPVSSQNVTERMGRVFSSATIRNIMGQLEDEGYLYQPHTSAGRVPTDKAYRYYVNRIRDSIELKDREYKRMAAQYTNRVRTLEEMIENASRFISRELRKASIVMWPSLEDTHLKHIDLLKVSDRAVLSVIVTMSNAVKHYVLELDFSSTRAELEKVANYLNANYRAASFLQIADNLERTKADAVMRGEHEIEALALMAQEFIEAILKKDIENEIYWEGLEHFMDETGLDDMAVLKRFVQAITRRHGLISLMRKDLGSGGMRAHIGEECGRGLSGLSIITCGYELRGRTAGRLGVIGPIRMDYERVLATVKFLTELLSSQLEGIKEIRGGT